MARQRTLDGREVRSPDEPWGRATDEPGDGVVEMVVVDGAAMSFRSYRRREDEGADEE